MARNNDSGLAPRASSFHHATRYVSQASDVTSEGFRPYTCIEMHSSVPVLVQLLYGSPIFSSPTRQNPSSSGSCPSCRTGRQSSLTLASTIPAAQLLHRHRRSSCTADAPFTPAPLPFSRFASAMHDGWHEPMPHAGGTARSSPPS
jgi:hypothetical protein